MTIDELITRMECQDLVFRFGLALDTGAYNDAADLITTDGIAVRPDGESVVGDAVRELLLTRPASLVTRHVLSNVLVEVTADDAAKAQAYVLSYRLTAVDGETLPRPMPNTPQAAGDWRMEFRRTPDGWRISKWEAVAAFVSNE